MAIKHLQNKKNLNIGKLILKNHLVIAIKLIIMENTLRAKKKKIY